MSSKRSTIPEALLMTIAAYHRSIIAGVSRRSSPKTIYHNMDASGPLALPRGNRESLCMYNCSDILLAESSSVSDCETDLRV